MLAAGQAALAAAVTGTPAPAAAGGDGADLGTVLKVHGALAATGTDLYDVMADTGLSLRDARRALAELTAAGHATQDGPGRYART